MPLWPGVLRARRERDAKYGSVRRFASRGTLRLIPLSERRMALPHAKIAWWRRGNPAPSYVEKCLQQEVGEEVASCQDLLAEPKFA
jgi:hypothetical protein